ncbi:2-phosphosulfolactate phosphatase [Candidatus Woesearchaeota archaeon]|nr:2-phosphosulfolactate phosphatase [Candidatus Woesearchaeota archaeon]
MNIKILNLIEGSKQATGLTVIIDVFRAFSVACYCFGNGANKIIPLGDINEAYKIKEEHEDYILIGERNGKKPEGFDYGNSPTQLENINLKDKTIIQTTSAGTQGIVNVKNATEIITGSFVNIDAIINYIKKVNPEEVSLVAMGAKGVLESDEDKLCAQYIKNALENKPNDFNKIKEHLRTYISAQKFFDETKAWAPRRDFDLCLNLNRFNFVIKYENKEFILINI